jgi:hypothetical protein
MIQGVIALIEGDATCGGLIGSFNGATKVFPVTVTQEVQLPYVTVRRTGLEAEIVKGQAGDVDKPFIDVASFAKTYKAAMDISNAIRDVVDNYTGTSATVVHERIWYQSSEDLIDEQDDSYVIIDRYAARIRR